MFVYNYSKEGYHMKKTILLLISLSCVLLSITSCGKTSAPAENPSTTVTQTTKFTTTLPVKPTLEDGSRDYSYFDDCAFLGNSRFLALGTYGLVDNCFSAVGLTVDSVYTNKLEGSDIAVIDELDGNTYSKVFILFGDNECGWPNLDVFREKYENVINTVKEKQPNSDIYATSVLPVSSHASKTNKYGVTNENIDKANDAIKIAAENCKVHYLDINAMMKNDQGALPDEAASDGIHLTKEYCEKWLDFIYDIS